MKNSAKITLQVVCFVIVSVGHAAVITPITTTTNSITSTVTDNNQPPWVQQVMSAWQQQLHNWQNRTRSIGQQQRLTQSPNHIAPPCDKNWHCPKLKSLQARQHEKRTN